MNNRARRENEKLKFKTQISYNMSIFSRNDGRAFDQLREMKIKRNYLMWPEGSCLMEMGNTKIITTVSVEKDKPKFVQHGGWITAEYSMLPRATETRNQRERGQPKSRSLEIQRIIGRAIRGAVPIEELDEITLKIDCDVIQADGGTRCASVNGAIIAIWDALQNAKKKGIISNVPKMNLVGAVSVGYLKGSPILDLNYKEDSEAEMDLNLVMDENLNIIEIQGTAEHGAIPKTNLYKLIDLAEHGIKKILEFQKQHLK